MITTAYSLAEICKIRSGKRLPKGCDFSENPTAYKYIRARDIKNGTIDGSDLVYISEEVQSKIKKYIVNTNDIVITIVGASVGDVAYVTSEYDGMNLTENAVRLTEFAPYVNPKYLMYILNSTEYWELMQQIAGGAAQPKLGIYKIEAIKVQLPPKEVQDRIVDVLCAYDELIENNQKQIKLLEEAAQRLYKEWFVDLRFPGHETTPITDGIPEGWNEKTIVDVCTKIGAGGTPSRSNETYWNPAAIKWFKTGELMDCWLLDSSEKISEEGLSHSSAKLFPPNTIFMAIYASPTLGRLGILTTEATCNQAALCLMANESIISWQWLYQKLYELRDEFNAVAKGAGQQNISADVVKKKTIIVPSKKYIDQYTSIAAPIFDSMRILQEQNAQLQEARDRLLPKLMNGEIEV